MNRHILTAFAALALTGVAPALGSEVTRESSERVIEATGIHALKITNSSGRVDVRASADGLLHVRALKILRGTTRERARLSAETRVETSLEQGVYVIHVIYWRNRSIRLNLWDLLSGSDLPRSEVQLTIEAPANLPLMLMSSSADLSTEGLAGSELITTSSGDVSVRGARGALDVTSSSGDLTGQDVRAASFHSTSGDLVLTGVHGPLVARTSSGDVTVKEAEDALSIRSVSGDIRIEGAPRGVSAITSSGEIVVNHAAGVVVIETSSGDVRLSLHPPLAGMRVSTSSGDVQATLAPEIGGTLDLRTSSGSLDVTLPVQIRQVDRHSLMGAFGHGTTPLTLRSTSGDIHLSSGGNP